VKLSVHKGATSVLVRVFIQDSTSTAGAGLSGLVFNSSGLTCYQMRDDDGNAGGMAVTLATATLGTWATGGFKEKDSTNCPGWYEFGIPNAALATGSRSVDFHFKGAANMVPLPVEIELTGWDNQDAVHGGISALPNTACTTNASLLTSGVGTDQLSVTTGRVDIGKALGTAVTLDSNNVLNVSAKYWAGTAIAATSIPVATTAGAAGGLTIAGANAATSFASGSHFIGTVDTLTTYTGNTVQTGDAYARLGAPAGASIAADLAEIEGETDGIAAIPTTPLLAANVPTNFAALLISAGGHISNVDTLTTYTSNTPQTGDSFARLGAPAGASVSADIAEIEGETDSLLTGVNIAQVNGHAVIGNGSSGTPWGPA
jgi:hypothetical protein